MNIYPTSAIKKLSHRAPPPENENGGYYEVELANDDSCRVSYDTVQNLMRANSRYFAAYPGCVLLEEKIEPGGNDPFHRIAVLGWAIDEEGALEPVTGEGVGTIKHWAVLAPDGTVADRFGGTFANEERYLEALHEDEE